MKFLFETNISFNLLTLLLLIGYSILLVNFPIITLCCTVFIVLVAVMLFYDKDDDDLNTLNHE
jgi:uncharacterized membrane protein YfhO